jgi:argininosuccinate lyase
MNRTKGHQKTPGAAAKNPARSARLAAGPAAALTALNASIGFDRRLYAQDIRASLAHCSMLAAQGILSQKDCRAIADGLRAIRDEIEAGKFKIDWQLEDIHMHVEARLGELIGDAAGRLHTARSRNDQVATDFRLWVRDAIDRIDGRLAEFQHALLAQAESHAAAVMPGFTHLQTAQPVTFGHHMLAYVEMTARDRDRFKDARRRLNECPLGAAALAGTSFPIDRQRTAKELGFDRPMANSLDAVSDRDFALEFLAAAAIAATHLSRLAEELVLWSTPQFGFVRLSDAWATGSSIMPQKRNPDAAELVRAKAGRMIAALVGLLAVMKGLPLAYAKDMQEDKEPVFDAAGTLELCLTAMSGMVRDMAVDEGRMRAAAGAGYATATDLADWLVQKLGRTFRQAHAAAGQLVRLAEQKGVGLEQLTLADFQSADAAITADVLGVLGVDKSVASRASFGGTAPKQVRSAIARWRKELGRAGDRQ